MENKSAYISFIRSEREYLKVILSNIIGRFGDSIDSIAYGWMVYELTGSSFWLAVVYGVNSIPTILFQPFAGALVEYVDKKRAVFLCDMGRGCIVFLTGMMLLLNVLQPWHLLILTFLNSCFESFRIPCSLSIIPGILKKQDYGIGLSLNQSASRIFELIGLGCSGVIIGTIGSGGAIIADAFTFFISALLFLTLRIPKSTRSGEHGKISIKGYLNELHGGILYFKKNHVVLMVCVIGFLLNITAVPLEKLQAAYVNECLELGVNALSLGGVFMSCGLVLGTLVFVQVKKAVSNKTILVYGGMLIGFLYFGLMFGEKIGSVPLRYMAYASVMGIFGFINSLIGMSVQVTFMSETPAEYVGRAGSIFGAMACSSIPAGTFLVAVIVPFLSIVQIYFLVGVVTVLIFAVIGRLKAVKEIQ